MTLILVPCGRGNWTQWEIRKPGCPDLALIGQRVWIDVPPRGLRSFWIKGVVA